MCGADDVRRSYKGCFADGDGPYTSMNHTLPATLSMDGLTYEQCAQAAGQAGYDVFAIQTSGYCFMGKFDDVAQMKQKLDDATCSTTPCVGGIGCIQGVNKVYSSGASPTSHLLRYPVS